MFPNYIHDIREGYSSPYKFRILSFNESHDAESILLWIKKVDKLFDMKYIPLEDHIEFVAHKLKRRTVAWCDRF